MNSFFAVKYFCNTQTGLSIKNATRLPNPRKIHTTKGLFNCNKKKNTRVKWKHIHTNEDIHQYRKKFLRLTSSNQLSTDTKFDILMKNNYYNLI